MSFVVTETINFGTGDINVNAQGEYTDQAIAVEFGNLLLPFQELIEGNAQGTPVTINAATVSELQDNLNALLTLARDGKEVLVEGIPERRYLTVEMLLDFKILLKSFEDVGVTGLTIPETGTPSVSITEAQASLWVSLAAQTSLRVVLRSSHFCFHQTEVTAAFKLLLN